MENQPITTLALDAALALGHGLDAVRERTSTVSKAAAVTGDAASFGADPRPRGPLVTT